jgi:hypothetical protein
MQIPDCYEADRQEEARDLAYTARIMRRPRCERCDTPILSESYLDLSAFGLNGLACERCVNANTHATCDLED